MINLDFKTLPPEVDEKGVRISASKGKVRQ